jgi:hypothetical protein
MDIIGIFNTQLNDFLDKLIIIFPGDSKISSAKLKLSMLYALKKSMAIELFILNVMSHKDEILMKNETYFLTDTERLITDDNKDALDMNNIANLKDKWLVLSVEQKNIVWQYFGIMIKLSEKYVASIMS